MAGQKDRASTTGQMAEFAGVGLQFAGAILLFLFAGRWLDEKLGTEPWLLLSGVMIGAAAGFYSMYWQLVLQPRKKSDSAPKPR